MEAEGCPWRRRKWSYRAPSSYQTAPYHTFTENIPAYLLDVLPNPAAPTSSDQLANHVAILAPEGLVIANVENCTLATPLAGPFTAGTSLLVPTERQRAHFDQLVGLRKASK
jgi:hypothetical protein